MYIYTTRSIRVRDATCGENGPCCVKNVVAPSLVRINIDIFLVLVSGKFPCFLQIGILFILNYKLGTKSAKIYSTGNAKFIPTYNKKAKALVKNLTLKHVEKRMQSYLSGLRINITLIFMSSSSYLVHAISCRRILLKYRFLLCLLSFFLSYVSTFYFFFDNLSPTTRHPLPVTRYPPPVTRHPSPVTRGKVLP